MALTWGIHRYCTCRILKRRISAIFCLNLCEYPGLSKQLPLAKPSYIRCSHSSCPSQLSLISVFIPVKSLNCRRSWVKILCIHICQEQPARVRACNICKIRNRSDFPTSTENSNKHCTCCIEISHFVKVVKRARDQYSIYNNFDWTTSFYWSYMLLL